MSENIPHNWKIIQLGEVASIVSGGTPSRETSAFWGKDIPWVTPTDITNTKGRFLFNTAERLSLLGLNSSSASLLPPGTILMTSRATVGDSRIAEREVCTNQGFKSLIPNKDIDSLFLFYQMQRCREDYKAFGIGSTFLEVSKKDSERFELLLPNDLEEQKAISKILDCVDQTIEKTEALIHKYQQIKTGLMHDLFTRGLTADGKLRLPREQAPELYQETPIGWIPKEWGYGLLNDIVNPLRPIVYGILMPGYGFDGGILVVKVKDIQGGKIDADNLLLTTHQIDNEYRRSRLKSGDILLTIRGTVGRICIVPDELENANITQDTARIDLSEGNNEFYGYYFETDGATRHFSINTLGVAVQGINLGEVRKTPIPKTPSTEQAEIAKRISSINDKIDREKENCKKLRVLKSGLMHDLLTGKVQVTIDPDETTHHS